MHLSRSHLSAERLNLFGFLIVQCGQTLLRVALRSQQFIKLGVNSLCISVLRALDEKRHQQGRNACNGLPVERLAIEDQPEPDVDANGHNRLRSGQPRSGICQGTIEAGAHAKQRAVESTVPLPYLEQLGKRSGPSAGGSTGATWGVSLGDDTAGLTASCPIGSSKRLVLPNALPAFTTIQTHDLTRRAIQDRVHKGWERAARCAARAVLLLIDRFVRALCHSPSTVVLFA
jgi:hypothetical protein